MNAEQPSFFDPPELEPCGLVRFGTSSFSSEDWVGSFYPAGTKPADFLRYYASQFDTVEVDATYYHIPPRSTVEAWARKTPRSFVLSAKFPRSIVHGGDRTEPNPRTVLQSDVTYAQRDEFLQVMSHLGPRLGPLVLQFPYFPRSCFAHSNEFFERLDRFLEDSPSEFDYAVEIRNSKWLGPELAAVCRKHRAALVLVDRVRMPHGDELLRQLDPVTGDFAYIRLLGDRHAIERVTRTWNREVIDHQSSLERWAEILVRMTERQVPTFVYANNHYAGHGPTTIRRLQALYDDASRSRREVGPEQGPSGESDQHRGESGRES